MEQRSNRFDLQRFVSAQQPVYATALAELKAGHKRSHWMWFIFPQAAGLARSAMAQRYAIGSMDEARAYLAHPLLGTRLRECTEAVLSSPDDAKFRSAMTLFSEADRGGALYKEALKRYYGGEQDQASLKIMNAWKQV